jgi:predicted nucleic acid-binding protein
MNKKLIADTVCLRVMSFAHPQGIQILLNGLNTQSVRFPAQIYNWDEDSIPIEENDDHLSELARGLRYAQRQISKPSGQQARYQRWLTNAQQLSTHKDRGLIVDLLTIEELQEQEKLLLKYQKDGCDRGEAACLVLAQRYQAQAVFLSSDKKACKVAEKLGINYKTLPDILEKWVQQHQPNHAELDTLIQETSDATFRLKDSLLIKLRINCK